MSACSVRAEVAFFDADNFSGFADLRVALADGERSFIDGGFGKTRVSGTADRGFDADLTLAHAHVIWRPRLGWALEGVVDGQLQVDEENALGIGEAYLRYKPVPKSGWRWTARAGLLYPPISLEHGEPGWIAQRTLTPSAINSWVGEEVKTVATELAVFREFGGHDVGLAAAVFGFNDTSGTLLSFRGWALHDLKASTSSDFPLPPLSNFVEPRQAPITTPVMEIDDRIGYYARFDWRPPGRFAVNAFYYDNRGDDVSVKALQWAWDTTFVNLGLEIDAGGDTEILAQALRGTTSMGFFAFGEIWVDVEFDALFVLASRTVGKNRITARFDLFGTDDRSLAALDDNNESGWAVTGAYSRALGRHVTLVGEVLHVESERPSRALAGLAADQSQTVMQAALRLSF